VVSIAVLAYAALVGANALGQPWLGWSVALLLFAAYFAYGLYETRKQTSHRREARWERAIYDAAQRPQVIAEVRKELRGLTPVRPRNRAEHARLSVLLAELLDAQGEHVEANKVIDAVPLLGLAALDVGLVRHTRAVTHLRAGDPQGALAALGTRDGTGDAELDQRLALLEAYAHIEQGNVKHGLALADSVARLETADESVQTEARVVRAAALDAEGRREEALVVLAALGRDSLVPLSELGQPRVRSLARQVLEGVSSG
jgi:hypothetical protein